MPLSEKAKGKQRANLIPEDTAAEHGSLTPKRELMVRFTEGVQDLVLRVAGQDTVRDVKVKIREARPQLQFRRLRLIHAGRLLTDGTQLASWLNTLEERQQRAATKSKDDDPDPFLLPITPTSPATPGSIPWLHCSVGAQLAEGEEDSDAQPQEAQIKPLRGFDRLAAAGFSEEDILNFRRQFHSRSAGDYLSTAEFPTDEEYEEHARALEEQWIDALGNGSSVGGGSPESDSRARAVLNGVIIGFFFPLLPFFFLRASKPAAFWESGHALETPESAVFSRRMQMGLVVGFILNVVFGSWRYLWGTF
ncbi:DUF2407 C-terminal domain-containing protein [Multifurca ochricompacta]|uniref:DUF2407 C-terminal domain-containing protein n=1 Tax=Multifurca ochricompacta TaxID=376703 RepID=A0AAD4QMI3_9AGAM|nr:DUF2407 C-terminal domain-containing protein [Multifurca ochricompacta]